MYFIPRIDRGQPKVDPLRLSLNASQHFKEENEEYDDKPVLEVSDWDQEFNFSSPTKNETE